MKRILVVLALLALCSMGFSVSGKVYGRLVPSGWGLNGATSDKATAYWYAGENWWGIPLDDLRVGRQGTGVSVNFDTFTLDYKLRAPLGGNGVDVVSSIAGGSPKIYTHDGSFVGISVVPTGAALTATSPGYFQISGLKLGSVDLGIGASWWTLGQGTSKWDTNAAGVTNNDLTSSVGYNLIALDVTYNIQVGDLSINARPWNKANMYFWTGSATRYNNLAQLTNTGDVSGFHLLLPIVIDYSMEALSLEIYTKFAFDTSSQNMYGAATLYDVVTATSTTNLVGGVVGTNNGSGSSFNAGGVVKIGYVVNELVSVYAAAGIESDNATATSIFSSVAGAVTNVTTTSSMFMPIFGGVSLAVSPALTFNLGLGYDLVLGGQNMTITSTAAGAATNNGSYVDSHFQSEWDTYEMHAYYKPLIKFAANTKFAGDFSAGLVYVVMLNENLGAGDNDGYKDVATKSVYGYDRTSNWLNFVNIPDFDAYGGSAAYIGYAKDNYEVKAWFGNETQLAGLFSHIDFTIKY